MKSLRAKLVVWLVGLLTAASLVAGMAAYLLVRQDVDSALDTQLRQIALNVGDGGLPNARAMDPTADPEDDFIVTVWDQSGAIRSTDAAFQRVRPAASGFLDFQFEDESWRAFVLIQGDRTVQVAQRTVVREEFAAGSALRSVLPTLGLILVSWIAVGLIVARTLRPVRAAAELLRRRRNTDRSPLALSDVPDEILPLTTAVNDLIVRLQTELEFRKQFISDAAHELRTPLTALRIQVQNLHGASGPDLATFVEEIDLGLRRMSAIISQLLKLARAEATDPVPGLIPVDIETAISEGLQDVMPLAIERGVDIGVTRSTTIKVLADPEGLRGMLGNLLDNAIRYGGVGGIVDLDVSSDGSTAIVEIRDTGPGITPSSLATAFDRFNRCGTTEGDGSGLGLAIVKAVADRCGASVCLLNRMDRSGLIARVAFAIAPATEVVEA